MGQKTATGNLLLSSPLFRLATPKCTPLWYRPIRKRSGFLEIVPGHAAVFADAVLGNGPGIVLGGWKTGKRMYVEHQDVTNLFLFCTRTSFVRTLTLIIVKTQSRLKKIGFVNILFMARFFNQSPVLKMLVKQQTTFIGLHSPNQNFRKNSKNLYY